jgi:BirA family biotin operon repressor/biotin-[acetyl-CoA-carboxylase] ligase
MKNFDADYIRASIKGSLSTHLDCVEVFQKIDSTNDYLLNMRSPSAGQARVAIAESQSAGRGRRGKFWQSPRDSGIYLSFAYTFADIPANLSSLTLAVGISVVRSLEKLGIAGLALKWPNDIVADGGKVGGILTETVASRNAASAVVVGIGLNVDLSLADSIAGDLNYPEGATDLKSCTSKLPNKGTICIALIESLFECVVRYEAKGFAPFLQQWRRLDWLLGRQVEVNGGEMTGTANGIDDDGALIVNAGGANQRVISGSVRVIK